MFNFQVRVRPNVASSPGSQVPSSSSPKQPGEIDTKAPIQSVRAAVTLFGDQTSPKNSKLAQRIIISRAADERVSEKETELHWTLKELDKYKEQLKNAEHTKAQARQDLDRANKTLQELTHKLDMIFEGKEIAIQNTEAAKSRALELEFMKSKNTQVAHDDWEEDVANERMQYKTSANELISIKQELTTLRQDFDAALDAKLTAIQEASDAQHAIKVNQAKMAELSKEVNTMSETFLRVKVASEKAQEEHDNIIDEKENRILSLRKAKDELDLKIESLKRDTELAELKHIRNKLEETTEAINVLEEQLQEVRVADMETLEDAKLEVEEAKERLEEIKKEEASVQAMVETLKQDLEKVQRDISLLRGDDLKREQQQANLDRLRHELEGVRKELAKTNDSIKELESKIKKAASEAEKAKKEEKDFKQEAETLQRIAEQSDNNNKEEEDKLEAAHKELEKAKAAEEATKEQIRKRISSTEDKVKMTAQEYEALKKKSEEAAKSADTRVATAATQVETIKKKEKQIILKLEKSMQEAKDIEIALNEALKMAEMAEAAQEAIENELRKWRE